MTKNTAEKSSSYQRHKIVIEITESTFHHHNVSGTGPFSGCRIVLALVRESKEVCEQLGGMGQRGWGSDVLLPKTWGSRGQELIPDAVR